MFKNLQNKANKPFQIRRNKKLFCDTLPNEFQRKETIEIAVNFNIKERTADNFLKAFLGKYLIKYDAGFYKKTQQ
ncbi:hypothetical protein SAMN02745938_11115 [Flavobacterium psychrophilum DSM 3660]|nr:hypothetical protein FPG3_04905 [Flavobacterium psychrophilum FPG3]OXB06411.1 hypothetical protein B0A57_11730 [Flavobacterium psychrophilum DSM 3660 = ATCC 49418]SCY21947.1 hypothetical protein SAMN02745938_11115 [Flavobacterium psychrophilum DSM 3660] [Flavobacterium psychrophilum DSM 3660 = ATCC 49418]SNB01073.1 hypothetical protein FPC831_1590007 [Flavobacterium psychrophilum]